MCSGERRKDSRHVDDVYALSAVNAAVMPLTSAPCTSLTIAPALINYAHLSYTSHISKQSDECR